MARTQKSTVLRNTCGLFAAMALGVSPVGAQSSSSSGNWDLYLLFGQSNMSGQGSAEAIDKATNPRIKVLAYNNCTNLNRTYNNWYTAAPPLHGCYEGIGPGDWFSKTIADSIPGDTIGLIPCAIGGVDIDYFRKGVVSSRRSEFSIPPDNHWTGAYEWMAGRVKLAQQKGTVRGILLHQGESDNGSPLWVGKVKEIIDSLKKDLSIGDVPVLVGELPYTGCCSSHNTQIAKIPANITNSKVVSASGLTSLIDRYHLNNVNQREFGKRYAAAFLSLRVSIPVPYRLPEENEITPPQVVRNGSSIEIFFSQKQANISLYSLNGQLIQVGSGLSMSISQAPAGPLLLRYSDGRAVHSLMLANAH